MSTNKAYEKGDPFLSIIIPAFNESSEIYNSLKILQVFLDSQIYSFPQKVYTRTITVTSHSKDLALAGERIGYAAIHPADPDASLLMDALVFSNRVLGFVNAPALMQMLVAKLQDITVNVQDYQSKRDSKDI